MRGSGGGHKWVLCLATASGKPTKPRDSAVAAGDQGGASTSRQTYGSPRVHAALTVNGDACGKHRVAHLMRQHGIGSCHKRKFRVTTNFKHTHPVAGNLLERQFTVAKPNRWWVSDITYIPTREGWLYLAVTLDLYHRKVMGWAMNRWMTQQLVIDAFMMAIENGKPGSGLSHHSDQGVQYACHAFRLYLKPLASSAV